jgi:hypothetical protein
MGQSEEVDDQSFSFELIMVFSASRTFLGRSHLRVSWPEADRSGK